MRKYLLFVTIFFIVLNLHAQMNDYGVAQKFQTFYNRQQTDSIFSLFSPMMKEKLPLEKSTAVFSGLHVQMGDMKSLSFTKQDSGFTRYKADFTNQTFTMLLAVNKDGLMDGIRFVPYVPDPSAEEKADSKSNFILKTNTGNIYGTLKFQTGIEKTPVVLIVPGSGPIDRNGNGSSNLKTNSYKQLADSLMNSGIATLRYDKRGLGESIQAASQTDSTFKQEINDVEEFIQMLRSSNRFSKIIVLGHSEGSLQGMIAAVHGHADGFISVSGAGEPIDKTIERQLNALSPALAVKATNIFDSLSKGFSVNPDPELVLVFNPSSEPYFRSWLKYNPVIEIKKLKKMPVLIVQGNTDLQVRVKDAQLLKEALPGAKLVIIDQMNHVLKQSGIDSKSNTATYSDPALPLKSELVKTIETFVLSIN